MKHTPTLSAHGGEMTANEDKALSDEMEVQTSTPSPQTASTQTAATQPKAEKAALKLFKGYFTATRIAYLAVFTALSFVLYLPIFEFSLFPAIPFMKIDFSNTFVLIAGFSLGPVAGVIVGVLKEFMHGLIFSQTIGVGELANILLILPFVLIPSIIYKRHKGIKWVLVSLLLASLAMIIWSVPVSYLLTFPFFMSLFGGTWQGGMSLYLDVWYWAVLFNLIKVTLITAATLMLYKSVSRLVKMTSEKFQKASKKKSAQKI